MRSCPNCGAQFSDQEVFCPVCGQEVQIVPDFGTAEIQLQELHKRIEEEEKARQEARERAEMIQKRIRQRRNHIILVICLAAAAVAAWFIVSYAMKVQREHNSFSYQYTQAETLLESGDADGASDMIRRALAQKPDDHDALFLEVKILQAQHKKQDAENLLYHIMELWPEDEESYFLLLDQYLEENRTEDIQTILMSCTLPRVLERYARFLPEGPVLFPEEGVYNTDQEISFTSEVEGTIYYTLDGSDPTNSSQVYEGPFLLTEGITTVKSLLITNEGFPSPVTAGIYQIQYDAPPPPEILPESGTYSITRKADADGKITDSEREKTRKITLKYPDGYICHYSFDKKPTEESPVYDKPLDMQEGEHIFYAVLEAENGKLGMVASATYIYDVRVLTPTPAPKPKTYYYPGPAAPTAAPTPDAEGGDGGQTPVSPDDPSVQPDAPDGADPSAEPTPASGGGEDGSGGGDGTGGGDTPAPSDGGDASGGEVPAPSGGESGAGGGEAPAPAPEPAPAPAGGDGGAAPAPADVPA